MRSTKNFIVKFIKQCQEQRNSQYTAILKRDYPDILDDIQKRFPAKTTSQSLYNFVNNISTHPVCCCGNKVKFISYKKGYQQYCCKKCGDGSYMTKNKRKITNLKKYGNASVVQSHYGKEKKKRTMNERYGVDHYSKTDEFKNKFITTMNERYGVDYAMQSSELSIKHKQTLQANYGVDYPLQNKKIHSKMKQTMKKIYGKCYSSQVEDIFKKQKKTMMELYGVEYAVQQKAVSDTIQQKRRVTLEQRGEWVSLDLIDDATRYYNEVWKYTRKQPIEILECYEKRALAGVEGAYHLDHKVSIKYGFENSIPPYIIGNIHNLQMLPWKHNIQKSKDCSISFEQLCNLIF